MFEMFLHYFKNKPNHIRVYLSKQYRIMNALRMHMLKQKERYFSTDSESPKYGVCD